VRLGPATIGLLKVNATFGCAGRKHPVHVVLNATYDEVEQRWKAGFFRDLKRDAQQFLWLQT
jgi:hypothetical protein